VGTTLTIGDVTQRTGVAQTALRYYEQVGLLPAPERVGGQRRYQESVLLRLEVIRLCKTAGFSLAEIGLLLKDDTPGRPVARELAQTKLAEIDAQLDALARARAIIEWGMRCTCPSIELCTCGIHHELPA
jgi:MerR family transcriptional regulator, redox-sensitive transcriptional activator SoxR